MTQPTDAEVEAVARAMCGIAVRKGLALDWTRSLATTDEDEMVARCVGRDWPKHADAARAAIIALDEVRGR